MSNKIHEEVVNFELIDSTGQNHGKFSITIKYYEFIVDEDYDVVDVDIDYSISQLHTMDDYFGELFDVPIHNEKRRLVESLLVDTGN